VFTDPRIEYRIKPSIFLIFNHLCHFPEGREIQPGTGVRIKPGMTVSGIYLPIQLAREKATNTITQCHHNHLALLKMLNKDGKINDAIIENMLPWGHCGFHVYLSPTIWPDDEKQFENLARYITRACFSTATHGISPLCLAQRTDDQWRSQCCLC
jgi:hypothetical protein